MRILQTLFLTLLSVSLACAATVTVSGSGTWNADASSSLISSPGGTWEFSFQLPGVIDTTPSTHTSMGYATTGATNFQYLLNGSPVALSLEEVVFFETASAGLFDLYFGNSSAVLNLYGAQMYSGGPAISLLSGTYPATASAGGRGSVTVSGVLSDVPEPATWLMLTPALGLLFFRKRR